MAKVSLVDFGNRYCKVRTHLNKAIEEGDTDAIVGIVFSMYDTTETLDRVQLKYLLKKILK